MPHPSLSRGNIYLPPTLLHVPATVGVGVKAIRKSTVPKPLSEISPVLGVARKILSISVPLMVIVFETGKFETSEKEWESIQIILQLLNRQIPVWSFEVPLKLRAFNEKERYSPTLAQVEFLNPPLIQSRDQPEWTMSVLIPPINALEGTFSQVYLSLGPAPPLSGTELESVIISAPSAALQYEDVPA